MRLTLRTMLAYLDDVLEPGDAQDLGHKIEESKFASEIVARIRNSTRRPRLAAPRVDARGMGGDPNTVAEYLDNVLPADRVPEFEKVCLESDVHLAETAACHQILTLVLGQPAEVEGSTRDRIHRIGSPLVPPQSDTSPPTKEEEPPVSAAPPALAEPPQPAGAELTPRGKAEVPDYLREEPRGNWMQFLLVLSLVFVLCAIVVFAMGPLNGDHPLAGILGLKKSDAPVANKNPEDKPANEVPPAKPEDHPATKPTDKATTPTEPGRTTPMPMTPLPANPTTPAVDPNKSLPSTPAIPMPMTPTLPVTPPVTPMPPVGPAIPTNPLPMPPVGPTDPAIPMPAPPMPMDVKPVARDAGLYISEDETLIVAKPDKSWSRLPTRSALAPGMRVLALPSYRPSILLAGGSVQVTLDGGTLAVIHSPDEKGISQIQIVSGRAMILTVAVAGAPVRLIAGRGDDARQGLVVFSDADSAVAVEVKRFFDPGADPQAATPHRLIELQTTSGSVTWAEGDRRGVPIVAGNVYRMLDADPGRSEAAEQVPDWVTNKNPDGLEQLASKALKELITPKVASVGLVLKEAATEDRRAEVRSLAVRSLAYLSDYDAFVSAFNDADQRSSWAQEFDVLQSCLAQGKDEAVLIQQSMERAAPMEGAVLYRMLWGYNADDLKKDEGAKRLVEYLDHQTLAVRVVAFENLRRITGMTQFYRPEYPAPRRKQYIQKWKERLADGGITHTKPGAVAPRTPPIPAAGPMPRPPAGGTTLPLPGP